MEISIQGVGGIKVQNGILFYSFYFDFLLIRPDHLSLCGVRRAARVKLSYYQKNNAHTNRASLLDVKSIQRQIMVVNNKSCVGAVLLTKSSQGNNLIRFSLEIPFFRKREKCSPIPTSDCGTYSDISLTKSAGWGFVFSRAPEYEILV